MPRPQSDSFIQLVENHNPEMQGPCRVQGGAAEDTDLLDAYSRAVTAVVEAVGAAVGSIRSGWIAQNGIVAMGSGSGVVITPDGYILTNSHVVHGARGLRIGFTDGSQREADVVGDDPPSDLALIRARASGLAYAGFGPSEELRPGQLVVALGNPLGFASSVSTGVVSALGRSLRGGYGRLIESIVQHTAPLNPGSSGGPLLDTRGRIVGINTAIVAQAQGIGFAIPSATARWVLMELLHHGRVRRGYLGIAGAERPLPRPQVRALGLDLERAVEVADVTAQGPAARAGVRKGDLMVRANGEAVGSVDDLHRILAGWTFGETLEVSVIRNGQTLELSMIPTEEH